MSTPFAWGKYDYPVNICDTSILAVHAAMPSYEAAFDGAAMLALAAADLGAPLCMPADGSHQDPTSVWETIPVIKA